MGFIDLFMKATPKPTVSDRVVGIDIGSSSIKLVELESRSGVITLTTYGELQIGPYANNQDSPGEIGQAAVLDSSVEQQALVDILRESAVTAKKAVLSIPLSSSFVTTMTLVSSADEDISGRVRAEARKYIPVPIADVTLDWAEISAGEGDDESRDVLLAAIQNDALRRFMSLMQNVELPAPPTEIECFSTVRAAYEASRPNTVIIDIGASVSKLYITDNGLLERMHRVPVGGIKVTEKLMSEKSLTFSEAENLKRTVTTDSADYSLVEKQVRSTYSRMLREFRQVIDEYEERTGHLISDVILTGGGAIGFNLETILTEELARPTTLIKPFNKVAYPAFMEDTLDTIGPVFATALGAALRQFE